jgi:hypothetical protein
MGANMKRDMALVREVLLKVESLDLLPGSRMIWHGFDPALGVEGYSPAMVDHHLRLLTDAGFIKGQAAGNAVIVEGLSWEGCEFLDTVRSPEVWKRTQGVAAKLGTVSLAVFAEIAKGEVKKMLGLP